LLSAKTDTNMIDVCSSKRQGRDAGNREMDDHSSNRQDGAGGNREIDDCPWRRQDGREGKRKGRPIVPPTRPAVRPLPAAPRRTGPGKGRLKTGGELPMLEGKVEKRPEVRPVSGERSR
jgi:hypothetical protein